MPHDIVIRGGEVIDGTGSAPRPADVAIDGDTITAVGDVPEPGAREIDATGHSVTPGFVDVHTHLDAQIGWDPMLTPLSWHGVTTALLGNASLPITIPNNAVFYSAPLFAQWASTDPNNPLGLAFSDGLQVLIER